VFHTQKTASYSSGKRTLWPIGGTSGQKIPPNICNAIFIGLPCILKLKNLSEFIPYAHNPSHPTGSIGCINHCHSLLGLGSQYEWTS